jgi:integrase
MYNRKSQEPREVERERSEDQRLAIRLQLLAGLREQEALGFRWEWMSWRRGVYSPGETKSRKTREIPLAETLLGLLRARWETQGRPASGLAMPDEETGEAHKKGYTSRTVRLSGRRVDVVGLHPHRLRATFATTLWEIGTPLVQISLMMGHTRPETTLGYIVQRRKDQAEAILRMAAAMGVTTRKPGPEPGLLVSSSTIVPLERAPVR